MSSTDRKLSSGQRRVAPPRIPTDEVILAHTFDDSPSNRSMVVVWTMRFNDVLDADKLYGSLSRLLQIGGWRKIGGRLRLTASDKLEIHIPARFTPDRPAVRYSHVSFDTAIDEHPLASRLPRPTEAPSIQEGGNAFGALCSQEGTPATFEDYIYSDEPQLALHIVSFTDATLVSFTGPHNLTDAMGCHALVTNWNEVLAGRESEVAPFLGFRDDPMRHVGSLDAPVKPRYVMSDYVLHGIAKLVFMVRFALGMLFGPKMEMGTIFLPAGVVKKMQAAAMADLVQDPADSGTDAKDAAARDPFLSEGDVLTAWATRVTCAHMSPSSSRPVTIMNVFEIRSRLRSIFVPAGAYIQNLFFPSFCLLTVREILTQPLGKVAAKIRAAILEQATEDQAHATVRAQREARASFGGALIVGRPTSFLIALSNWTKGRFFDAVDFSPAVIKTGSSRGVWGGAPGKPVYFHSFNTRPAPVLRNVFNILGRDHNGNYWVMGLVRPVTWAKFEDELRKLS